MTVSERFDAWLDSLGPMSPRLRDLAQRLVLDGPWMLDGQDYWRLQFRCYGSDLQKVLTVWRTTTGRMKGCRLELITEVGRGTSWAAVERMISS